MGFKWKSRFYFTLEPYEPYLNRWLRRRRSFHINAAISSQEAHLDPWKPELEGSVEQAFSDPGLQDLSNLFPTFSRSWSGRLLRWRVTHSLTSSSLSFASSLMLNLASLGYRASQGLYSINRILIGKIAFHQKHKGMWLSFHGHFLTL